MPTFNAKVMVTLKKGVLDPQGKAIEHALHSLSFSGVERVRQGKVFEVTLDADNTDAARRQLAEMAQKLLANTVIEDFTIEVDG